MWLLVVLVAVMLVLVVCLVAQLRSDAGEQVLASPHGEVVPSRRAAGWPAVGFVLGVVAAVLVAQTGSLGRGLLVAPAAFALCLLLGVLAGEMTVHAPSSGRRAALLERRQARDYLPARLTVIVTLGACLLLAVLTFTVLVGSADDMGRAGRVITTVCSPDQSASRGPWPGSYYALPLAALVLVGLVASAAVLRQVSLRPRPAGTEGLGAVDDALRRRSAEAVVAAVGILVAVPFTGIAAVAALQLLGAPCAPAWWAVPGWSLLALVPLLLLLAGWCFAVLVRLALPTSGSTGPRS